MCGICGIISGSGSEDFSSYVHKGLEQLNKRGPDNQSVLKVGNVHLGHARLSIIDLSEDGNQPFVDDSGDYLVVFNGEIYNYLQLKSELVAQGVQFRTETDTEVLLKSYIHWGDSFVKKLNGFFAFAIYDVPKGKALLARDRFGIKPMYVSCQKGMLAFASELKALREFPLDFEIDKTSLAQYFQFNYIPEPYSIYQNVSKVRPGCYWSIDLDNLQVQEEQYYSIPANRNDYLHISYEEAKAELRRLMDESVEERMVSDVPLGSFLSGGIDSSVIATLASRKTDKLSTFSVGYKDDPVFDETKYAQAVAEKIGTKHTVFSLSSHDLYEVLDDVLNYLDEPFADSSAIAVYILCKRTQEHITVALSGDGADEIFSGYNKHMAEYRVREKGMKEKLVSFGGPVWKQMPKSRNSKFGNLFRQLDKYAAGARLDNRERYLEWASITGGGQVDQVVKRFSGADQLEQRNFRYIDHINGVGDLNDVLLADMQLVLPGDMLVKVDRMSMANSLEVRVPFLSHKIVDFAFRLPAHYKIDRNYKKKILQDAFREELPEILYKRPKHGFEVPLLEWFRTDMFDLIFNKLLREDLLERQGLISVEWVRVLKKRLLSSDPGDSVARLWALIVFQHWYQKFHKKDL